MTERIQVSMQVFRQELAEFVERTAFGGERFVLTVHGRPRAVLVSLADLQRLEGSGDRAVRRRERKPGAGRSSSS